MARVLIVDDDQGILDATQLILEYEGYEVIISSDGEMVKNISEELPDVILLDIWLSGSDGVEIAQRLKKQSHTRHIPIILFSANRDIEGLAEKTGVEDILIKPFEMNDLLQKVKKYAV